MKMNRSALKKNREKFSGFTLVECLVSLVVLTTILLLFNAMIQHAKEVTKQLQSENEKMWHVFLIQMDNELQNFLYERTEKNRICLKNKKNSNYVFIEYKLGKIVKVDNGGYQPLLMKIKDAMFLEEDGSIILNATFENQYAVQGKWSINYEK